MKIRKKRRIREISEIADLIRDLTFSLFERSQLQRKSENRVRKRIRACIWTNANLDNQTLRLLSNDAIKNVTLGDSTLRRSLISSADMRSDNIDSRFLTRSPTLLDRYGGHSVSISVAVPLAA